MEIFTRFFMSIRKNRSIFSCMYGYKVYWILLLVLDFNSLILKNKRIFSLSENW
jgi:hypothetical protein